MSEAPTFSKRARMWIIGVAIASFGATVVLTIFGEDFARPPSHQPSAFSPSAIGHEAFVAMLRDLDVPIVVSRFKSADKAGADGVLLVIEPALGTEADSDIDLADMTRRPGRTLLVLPKWSGTPRLTPRGWLAQAELLSRERINEVLTWADVNDVLSDQPPGACDVQLDVHELQLLAGGGTDPILGCDGGTFLARVRDAPGELYVLSDPDVLSNYGLGRGDNAVIAHRVLEEVRRGEGAVIVDETLHGYEQRPSLLRRLFDVPLIFVTLHGLVLLACIIWAAVGRFGKPAPPPPAVPPGKGFLIDNTAELTRFGGHSSFALARYYRTTLQEVARGLHAPLHLDRPGLRAWLMRIGRARGVTKDIETIRAAVDQHATTADVEGRRSRVGDTHAILAAARDVHRWKQEILDGARRDTQR